MASRRHRTKAKIDYDCMIMSKYRKMGQFHLHGVRLISRRFSSLGLDRFSICVVGSGPAGFYTAEKMLKAHERVEIDILDRLPIPFGLVRSGVAPDHQETKIVVNQFSRVAKSQRCSFFGNITLGSAVTLSELREIYDVVVLAYGAESDKSLGIPGEEEACSNITNREDESRKWHFGEQLAVGSGQFEDTKSRNLRNEQAEINGMFAAGVVPNVKE
ncbi:hypothetical protein HPP92_003536 [Vanilla planifolia]|uniref:NADPH:adrenodoxin oxidoreductase, mitochondrial n=1 Tax=Vanilla planifolia TaxID=51239 RepID=A0A835S3D8_VANPL|nr:hypothetical protein HPP92_003536 [Vanilla planifolia]